MDLLIRIQVDDVIHLIISDTGTGMDAGILAKINSLYPPSAPQADLADSDTGNKIPRFGIGLAYVVNSLRDFFSGSFHFHIESSQNHGTVVTIDFPKLKGNGSHVKNTDR